MLVTPSPAVVALLTAVEESPFAQWFRATAIEYPLVYTLHIIAVALLFGPIAIWDWRMLRSGDMAGMAVVRRTAALGVALALPSGVLLFLAKPVDYAFNAAFQWKLLAVTVALCNVVLAHAAGGAKPESVAGARSTGRSGVVRAAAALSLVAWLAAIVLGRWIAFA